jgi:hypothetical protein
MVYSAETMKEIRAYQAGELASLAPTNGVYPSGAKGTKWWEEKLIYSPRQLPKRVSDVPKYIFLGDQIVAWLAGHLKEVTGDQRHEFWPGDFANGGEINRSRGTRLNWGLPALTENGEIISWKGVHSLTGYLDVPGDKDEWDYVYVDTQGAQKGGDQPMVLEIGDEDPEKYCARARKINVATGQPWPPRKAKGVTPRKPSLQTKNTTPAKNVTPTKKNPAKGENGQVKKEEGHKQSSPLPAPQFGVARIEVSPPVDEEPITNLQKENDELKAEVETLKSTIDRILNQRNVTIAQTLLAHDGRCQALELAKEVIENPPKKKDALMVKKLNSQAQVADEQVTNFVGWPNLQRALFDRHGTGKLVLEGEWGEEDLKDEELAALQQEKNTATKKRASGTSSAARRGKVRRVEDSDEDMADEENLAGPSA